MKNIWRNAIMGVVVGDALGCPVQFMDRDEILNRPCGAVTDMEGFGTFNLPKGSWTDDSSLTLAALDSIVHHKNIDCDDIMRNFVNWLDEGEYTPYGFSFDIGSTCLAAINNFKNGSDTRHCGKTGEHANGNGSLMRIMPAVLYAYIKQKNNALPDADAIALIDSVAALTHNHPRANMACGIYFFMARAILDRAENASISDCIQAGTNDAMNFYGNNPETVYYEKLRDIKIFAALPSRDIIGSGYVVKTLEAAIWSLVTTDNFAQCLLTAVNLGDDTDTVAAIAGGLAGLYYECRGIPEAWLNAIVKSDRIEAICKKADSIDF